MDLFDSLHTIPCADGSIVNQVCLILHPMSSVVTANVVNIDQQDGFDDCGLFAIAMVYDLCSGNDPVRRNYIQGNMRQHLESCFQKRALSTFPASKRHAVTESGIKCPLNLTASASFQSKGTWCAASDGYGTWYHEGCVPIPDVLQDEDDSVKWCCSVCV